jgi:prepilin-type N-terminal cleavage/methylation domain-containing protein
VRSRINFEDKNLLEKGFTLVELLVVIVILGVLAAVVVFAVGGITNKSAASACAVEVRTVNTATQAFYAQKSAYPTAAQAGATGASLIAFLQTAPGLNLLSSGTGAASVPVGSLGTYDATTGIMKSTVCP